MTYNIEKFYRSNFQTFTSHYYHKTINYLEKSNTNIDTFDCSTRNFRPKFAEYKSIKSSKEG
jgi:hypothetical protein